MLNINLQNSTQLKKYSFKGGGWYYPIYRAVSGLLSICFFVLLISLCFFNNSTFSINIKGQLLMSALFFVVIFLGYRALSAINMLMDSSKISFFLKCLLGFLFLFSIQIIIVTNISTWIGWDVALVVSDAVAAADSSSAIYSDYLSNIPNNRFLFYIIFNLIKLFKYIGLTDYWLGLSVIDILFVDVSIIVSILIINRIIYNGSGFRKLFYIISFFLIGISPWLIVPYSDIFSMPIISLSVLLCIIATKSKIRSKQLLYTIICGILFSVGWLLKATIIALLPAAIIVWFLYVLGKDKFSFTLRSIVLPGIFMVSFVATMSLFNFYDRNQTLIEYNREIETPTISYTIATGLVELEHGVAKAYGAWNIDVASLNVGTTEERDTAFKLFIENKMNELGLSGYLKFLYNKARWLTSEGNFFWLGEGGGTADFSNLNGNILRELLYNNGKHYTFWLHSQNGLWVVVFLGCCLEMLFSIFNHISNGKFDSDLFLRLSCFFIIFVLLFVEGRSRYLISFLPLFCIVSAMGYSKVIGLAEKIYSAIKTGMDKKEEMFK